MAEASLAGIEAECSLPSLVPEEPRIQQEQANYHADVPESRHIRRRKRKVGRTAREMPSGAELAVGACRRSK